MVGNDPPTNLIFVRMVMPMLLVVTTMMTMLMLMLMLMMLMLMMMMMVMVMMVRTMRLLGGFKSVNTAARVSPWDSWALAAQ